MGDDAILDGNFDIIRLANGTYRMYYTGINLSSEKGKILSAISKDGLVWQKENGVRVDTGGGSGYENRVVSDPYIIILPDGALRMLYTCTNGIEGVPAYIASAYSIDGLNWVKEGLRLSPGGRSDGYDNARACGKVWVEPYPGGYRLYYVGLDVNYGRHRILSAISSDTLTWTKESGVRIDIGATSDFENDGVYSPVITLLKNDTYRMFYTCNNEYAADNKPRIRSALSRNLIDWTKEDGVRIAPGDQNDLGGVYVGGRVFSIPGGFRIYYRGWSSTDVGQILSAVSMFNYTPNGSLESSIVLGNNPYSYIVSWIENVPSNTSVSVKLRMSPENISWSQWQNIISNYTYNIFTSNLSNWGPFIQYNSTLTTSDSNVTPTMSEFYIKYSPYLINAILTSAPGPTVISPEGRIVAARPVIDSHPTPGSVIGVELSSDGTTWQVFQNDTLMNLTSPSNIIYWRSAFTGNGNGTAFLRGLTIEYTIEHYPSDVSIDVGTDGTIEWFHAGSLTGTVPASNLTDAIYTYVTAHRAEAVDGFIIVPINITSATGGNIVLGDAAVDFAPAPRILSHNPTGTNVSLNAPIEISFSEAMNGTSLNITIAPSTTLTPSWSEDLRNVALTHPEFKENTTYNVTVRAGALSLEGAPMLEDYSWSFTTE
ncbi:MAG: Ig-like domain-containing protein, partial [Thermoplasmata archaeon]